MGLDANAWLDEVRRLYRRHKERCDQAARRVSDDDLFASVGRYPNSIAVLMKHLGGNHRSRWRDFLTTDGEKDDRDRDGEFVTEGDTRATVEAKWEEGWRTAFETLDDLSADDLERTVTIRGEPHTVVQALQRNLTHVAYHTGQIVQLARHFAADGWESLSVPPGASEQHNAAMRARFGDGSGRG